MAGLPGDVLRTLKKALLECEPFESDRKLRAVFAADDRLAPWRGSLPEADSSSERIDLFVAQFLYRRNREGQNVLVLFLQVLYEKMDEEDERHKHLNDVAVLVADALGEKLPPLAYGNLFRADAARKGLFIPADLVGYGLPSPDAKPPTELEPLPATVTNAAIEAGLESLKARVPDWFAISFFEKALQAARTVGRVETQENYGNCVGTAFLVSNRLVLTNAHVIRDVPNLTDGGVRFHVGLQTKPVWRRFVRQVVSSPIGDLDFALMELNEPLDVAPVKFSPQQPQKNQPANILQHPDGKSMQAALRYNTIVGIEDRRFYYITDTTFGSSGSPIFDDEWCVIGLHRAARWDTNNPECRGNEGVPITKIAPQIEKYV